MINALTKGYFLLVVVPLLTVASAIRKVTGARMHQVGHGANSTWSVPGAERSHAGLRVWLVFVWVITAPIAILFGLRDCVQALPLPLLSRRSKAVAPEISPFIYQMH